MNENIMYKLIRNQDAYEYCKKQCMLEQMVGNETWKHYQYAVFALDKQIPVQPDLEGDGYYNGELVYDTGICPTCGQDYEIEYHTPKYCENCGQALDWSEIEQ